VYHSAKLLLQVRIHTELGIPEKVARGIMEQVEMVAVISQSGWCPPIIVERVSGNSSGQAYLEGTKITNSLLNFMIRFMKESATKILISSYSIPN